MAQEATDYTGVCTITMIRATYGGEAFEVRVEEIETEGEFKQLLNEKGSVLLQKTHCTKSDDKPPKYKAFGHIFQEKDRVKIKFHKGGNKLHCDAIGEAPEKEEKEKDKE